MMVTVLCEAFLLTAVKKQASFTVMPASLTADHFL